jgi:predicted KAP-like P-loop ATPase
MWPDNETRIDLIGFRVHADLIRSVVTDRKMLPVTIGVFADWGGGKTSIMKMLEHDLDPTNPAPGSQDTTDREGVVCLYFNGWTFEGYDDAKSAIVSAILMALGEHKRFGPKVRGKVVHLLKSVNWMRVARLGFKHLAAPAVAAFVSGGASIVPALMPSVGAAVLPCAPSEVPAAADGGVDWEGLIKQDSTAAGPLDVRSFREQFAQLLKDSNIRALVVLIDDLDRCSPERIIENLEAIKLFLNVEQTAFVIGADPRIVRHAIAWRYRQYGRAGDGPADDADDQLVTDYLEKVIQVPYRLPRLSPAEVETYMALLFCQRHLAEEACTRCVTACEGQRAKNRYGVFGYGAIREVIQGIPDDLGRALAFTAAAAPLMTEGLKGNPRLVKRFLNALLLRKKLAAVANLSNVRDDVLVKLMILEYAAPRRFIQLFEWQAAQGGQPKQLASLEAIVRSTKKGADEDERLKAVDQDWATSFLRRWLTMEPSLGDVDLRDYFWVARDRLESTLSNLSMIPPAVRRVLEDLLASSPGKRPAAVKTAATLHDDERDSLLSLLEQYVKRHADQKAGYDALRALIEAGIGGAAQSLASILQTQALEPIPPAVGSDVVTLARQKPDAGKVLEPAIQRLRGSDTRIGKAAQSAKWAK